MTRVTEKTFRLRPLPYQGGIEGFVTGPKSSSHLSPADTTFPVDRIESWGKNSRLSPRHAPIDVNEMKGRLLCALAQLVPRYFPRFC